jgi:hypothetical protein
VTHPNSVVLASVRTAITDALEAGTPSQRKALLQELVSEIRVEGRGSILPTYRLPAGPVRVMSGMVDPMAQHKNRPAEIQSLPIHLVGLRSSKSPRPTASAVSERTSLICAPP